MKRENLLNKVIKIIVTISLLKKLKKVFGEKKSLEILDFFETLQDNPSKGKELTHVGDIAIKELKYSSFRFYFVVSKSELKLVLREDLQELLLKFVRMSKKKDQQKTIDDIKEVLKNIGFEGF